MKPNPFLYGLNTTLNCIQNPKKEEKMIFVFYKKNMESLYDIMLFRAKMNKNIFIYFIDDEWQMKFLAIGLLLRRGILVLEYWPSLPMTM